MNIPKALTQKQLLNYRERTSLISNSQFKLDKIFFFTDSSFNSCGVLKRAITLLGNSDYDVTLFTRVTVAAGKHSPGVVRLLVTRGFVSYFWVDKVMMISTHLQMYKISQDSIHPVIESENEVFVWMQCSSRLAANLTDCAAVREELTDRRISKVPLCT